MDTKDKIIEYITQNKQASANELTQFLQISGRAVFKQLAQLIKQNKLTKVGKPPKVYYKIPIKEEIKLKNTDDTNIPTATLKLIEKEFYTITPEGTPLEGIYAFVKWCNDRKFDYQTKAKEFKDIFEKYNNTKKNGLINGTDKFKNTFSKIFVDKVFYIDFYSVEVFGKTKLGQKLLYAKQTQNINMIYEIVDEVKNVINKLIDSENIDCVGFIPPTVKRNVQFMKEFENRLHLDIKRLNIVKVKTEISIPQKTLTNLSDRILNADRTMVVDDRGSYKNILLIDDAVGSGATLNQVAKAIRERGIVSGNIIGLSITGSFKGFDVISEI